MQSSTLALMAAAGEVSPMPDAAIFADTQAEPGHKTRHLPKGERQGIYGWLDWLSDQLPFPVYTVSKGNLTAHSLKIRKFKKDCVNGKKGENYLRYVIPVFGIMPDGEVTAALGRTCTADFKIQPIIKKTKELASIKRGQKERTVTQWIGISWDEMQRMKDSRYPWVGNRFPLIEMQMTRRDCKDWMRKKGYPEPPRSACYYCPFHGFKEWKDLRDKDPDAFKDAVDFDKNLRERNRIFSKKKMTVYLHKSCKPLDEVDFDDDKDKGQLTWDFKAECEGMCGV